MRYFDASALVKRYVREPGTDRVGRLLMAAPAATSRLSAVEVASALSRRCREGAFSERQLDRALVALDADLTTLVVVELTAAVAERAQTLLRRYPLRAGDAIQLASCLDLGDRLTRSVSFVAFDGRLSDAARAEGVVTD